MVRAMIRHSLVAFAVALAAAPLAAQPVPPTPAPRALTADEHAALRCAATFAIIAAQQAHGDPAAASYPPLAARGREFFVITGARLIDDAGLDDAGVKAAAEAEAAGARTQDNAAIMPFCLKLLDAEVPPS